MKYKVIISDAASKEFVKHIAFVANVNKNAAKETRKRIIEAMRSLEEYPNRFPFFNEDYIPKNKYHKMFVQNWYLVLYQIKDDTVYVDYIIDCRQDYGWQMK